jgi:hypothetical protein
VLAVAGQDVGQTLSAAALEAALVQRRLEERGGAESAEVAEIRKKLFDAFCSLRSLRSLLEELQPRG